MQVAAMQANHLQMVCCGVLNEESKGRKFPLRIADPVAQQAQKGVAFLARYYPKHVIIITAWASLLDTAFVRACGVRFPEGLYYEDIYFSTCLFFQAERVAYLDHVAYLYAYNAQSITNNPDNRARRHRDRALVYHMLEEKINALPDPQYARQFHHIFGKEYMAYCGDLALLKSPHRDVIRPDYALGKMQTRLLRTRAWLFCHHLDAHAYIHFALVSAIRLFFKEK
jgi:hypothetical protein